MLFDSELFKTKRRCFRRCWQKNRYITFDFKRNEFIEHVGTETHTWYWERFEDAYENINAQDWRYI